MMRSAEIALAIMRAPADSIPHPDRECCTALANYGAAGPRQCGKTTLARRFCKDREATFFDLESNVDLNRLQNPELALGGFTGITVLDEIQRLPELFSVLRVLVDREDTAGRFLILGSASPDVVRKASESLAGRVEFVELGGFDRTETGVGMADPLWLRGGFPRSFLADSEADSLAWREGFIRTFLERDIPQLGITIPAAAMRRFWTMLAHLQGSVWNASKLGNAMGLSDKTVRGYLDLLSGTFMVRQLQPWFENVGKRSGEVTKDLPARQRHPALLAQPSAGRRSCSVIQWWGIRGKGSWSSRLPEYSPVLSSSFGALTPAPSSTCSFCAAGAGTGSRSSATKRRGWTARCAPRSKPFDSITSGSSIQVPTRTRWTNGLPPFR